MGRVLPITVRQRAAIYGRWAALSRGHLSVGSAQATDLRARMMAVGSSVSPDIRAPRNSRPVNVWVSAFLVRSKLQFSSVILNRPNTCRLTGNPVSNFRSRVDSPGFDLDPTDFVCDR